MTVAGLKILVVGARYPFPPRQGSDVVAANTLPLLAARHELHLVSLVEGSAYPPPPPDVFRSTTLVPRAPRGALERGGRAALGLARGQPIMVALGRARELTRRVGEALARERFDAVLLFDLEAIQHVPASAHPRTVANVEDPPAIKLWRKARLPIYAPWERARYVANALVNERYERRVFPKLGRVLVLSKEDAEGLRRAGHRNVSSVPYGVVTHDDALIPSFEERTPGSIVLSGNMFALPNVDGVLHFLDDVFPLVQRAVPGATVWIVGADPDPRIAARARREGDRVVVTGRVPEVARYLREARVSVCPVRLRIGVQTKILEAMSWGTPVVSTVEGNSGVGGTPGEHLCVEATPRAMAERIAQLLRGERWAELSAGGLRCARAGFSWHESARRLEQHLAEVAAGAAAPR